MGHHYVPQFYLRGFTDGNTIWVHDRNERRHFPSQPKTIANENNLYTDEIERHFANVIEGPANPAIEKVRECEPLTESDRLALAKYIVALWKRVPEARSRVAARLPEIAASVRQEIHNGLTATAVEDPSLASLAEKRKNEVNNIIERVERERPPTIWRQSLATESSDSVITSLLSMQWRFLRSERLQFLTCDNPVFFFENEGIGRPTSELTVPFSSTVALWASRLPTPAATYLDARPAAVREINRRVAKNATRFVYAQRLEGWILPFVCKRGHSLNRLI